MLPVFVFLCINFQITRWGPWSYMALVTFMDMVSLWTFALVWLKLCDISDVGHGLRVVSPVCLWSHHTRQVMVSTTHVTPPHHTTHVTSPPPPQAPQAGTIQVAAPNDHAYDTPPPPVLQYCSIAAAHRCGPAALCHRSHPSCSHQALRRPTPSQFLTKFLPLKFLTKISPVVQCVYPPIASLFSTIVLCLDLNDLNC